MGMKYASILGLMFWSLLCLRLPRSAANAESAIEQTIVPPRANACQSTYDWFYENEPGVFAYWALCESQSDELGLDTLGAWPLAHGFTKGAGIHGGVAGPVADGECAAQTLDGQSKLEQQGLFLNKRAGTLALWLNAGAGNYPLAAESMVAIDGKSGVSVEVLQKTEQKDICIRGLLKMLTGEIVHADACAQKSDTWHRVAMTWNGNALSLYIDGTLRSATPYKGVLDEAIYYYQLFPGCCETGKQMSIAKALIANRAWTAAEAGNDFKPHLVTAPAGGVWVSDQKLGAIHREVLGYVDTNQDLSPAPLAALLTGLKNAGVTSLRYIGGGFPDADDWHGGKVNCTATAGRTVPSRAEATGNTFEHYMEVVAKPLHLDVDLTVNYGSNPPRCDQGGSVEGNAIDLVRFANQERHYGIKRWEIGNEQYSYDGPNIDLHPNPYFKARGHELSTYTIYEPKFYEAMKAADPTVQIAVPSAGPNPGYDPLVHYQVPLLKQAKFDALVLHSYPLTDPITDGATLYPERVAAGTQLRGTLLAYQTQLLGAGKSPGAIWVTEWNAEESGNQWSKQSMGGVMPLFTAMQLAEYMQAGVEFASWQAQGETDVCSTYNYDTKGESAYSWWEGCGNTALVYTGAIANVGEKQVGLKPGDLTPAARGFQILSKSGFVTDGEHMLQVHTDPVGAPWLAAYAATHKGSYAVLLVNRDAEHEHMVPVRLADRKGGAEVVVWSYGKPQYDHSRSGDWQEGPVTSKLQGWHGAAEVVLPPLSINVLIFE